MGCRTSSFGIGISKSNICIDSPLTEAERIQFETILSGIPVHCRQIILNLPPRQLLNFYQYHTMAIQHGLRKEWPLSISYEHRALKGLQTLLPTQKDHYIFFNFYTVLSASFLALGEFEVAIEGLYLALAIVLKYTPMDYRTISGYYHHLAKVFTIVHDWKAATHYLIKATYTARLMNDLDQEYIDILEAELRLAKERNTSSVSYNVAHFEVKRKKGESDLDFHRRNTAAIITSNAKHNTLQFHKDEFKCLSDSIYRDCISNDC